MVKVTLVSGDDKYFVVDAETAMMSIMIADMFECTESENPEEKIRIQNVAGDTLEKVILWAEHQRHNEGDGSASAKEKHGGNGISSWDLDFFEKFDISTMKQLISAADFLDMPGLLAVTCKIMAKRLKNKNPGEIRQILGIENDLDNEREEFIKKENEWCEEK